MTHGSHYLGKLYNDLIANSPQTISIDIPSDMGKGRIAQTQIKHGIIFSDWQMCYQSDMNVQGTVSKDYMQIIFCLNDAISWGIMDEKRSITIQKNESCIYAGHGGTEYACYKKDSNFSFKSIDNGQIAQQGTHEELLKQPGIYQEFVNIRKNAAGWSLA